MAQIPKTSKDVTPLKKYQLYEMLNKLPKSYVYNEMIDAIKDNRQISEDDAKKVSTLLIPEVKAVLFNLGYLED